MTTNEQLNTEADLAADYIEEILDIADIEGDLELGVKSEHAHIEIVAEDSAGLQKLVGEEGEVLDAIQKLARLAVSEQTGEKSSLIVDINKFRANKREALITLAKDTVAEVLETGEDKHLDSMNSYERKIIHDTIGETEAFSHSEGIRKERHVVVTKEEVVVPEKKVEEVPT